METCFFDESLFDGHLTEIRKRLRKEKQDKIASRVLNRLEAQQKVAAAAVEDDKKPEQDGTMMANGSAAEGENAAAAGGGQKGEEAAAAAAGNDDEENNPELAAFWQLCSKVCNLLMTNMSEAKEEISKRVTQLKSDVDMKDEDTLIAAIISGEISGPTEQEMLDALDKADGDGKEENAENAVSASSSTTSSSASTPDGAAAATAAPAAAAQPLEAFLALSSAPEGHKFYAKPIVPTDQKAFATAVRKDLKLMSSSLPEGILVRYERNL